MLDILRGAFEMHVHTSPDVKPRKCSDLELARRFKAAGLGGALIKCHYADTAPRAALVNEMVEGVRFFGGIVLNSAAGGLNPAAVEACGQMGGRMVWFPTMEARSYKAFHGAAEADLKKLITVFDENGELNAPSLAVLETAKKYNMLVGTGHLSPAEGMAVVRTAAELGVQAVVTHADLPACAWTAEAQAEAARLGAVIEHCYYTTYYDRTPAQEIAAQIRAAGVENVILSTDFGQPKSPYSDEGLDEYARLLSSLGFADDELKMMFCTTPKRLLGVE